MEELENFRKRVQSIINKAYLGGVTILPFLDDALQGIVIEELKWQSGINYLMDGRIINADRKRCIISPYEIKKEDFKIHILEIIYNQRYYTLYHRSVLGALMSLGIKREAIGDIVIRSDKRVFFSLTDEIYKYIKEEFRSVGKCPIELKDINEDIKNEIKYDSKNYFLASLRIDVIISEAYNLSRQEAKDMIMRADVSINHILNLNPSYICKKDDLISVRHKGRVLVTNILGTSRSGRIIVELSKRI